MASIRVSTDRPAEPTIFASQGINIEPCCDDPTPGYQRIEPVPARNGRIYCEACDTTLLEISVEMR